MKRLKGDIVPEFYMKKKPKAGFIPDNYGDGDVELWQVWCRSADGEESHRATFKELKRAGLVKKRKGSK